MSSNEDEFKLFVGGLSRETDEESLRRYFEDFGPVESVDVKRDRNSETPRGFGFVVFKNQDGVDKVLAQKAKGGHFLDNKAIDPKMAERPKVPEGAKVTKVFVGGVPTDLEGDVLDSHFSKFGKIKDLALVTVPKTNDRRGFIFVDYEDEESADRAVRETFHEIEANGTTTRVEVKRAFPRENSGNVGGGRGRGRGFNSYRGDGGRGGYGGGYGGTGGYGGGGYGYGNYYQGYPMGGGYDYSGGYGGYGGYGGGQGGGYGKGGYGPPAGGNSQGFYGGGGGYNKGGNSGGGYKNYGNNQGGPVRSNYHQGSNSYHPYQR